MPLAPLLTALLSLAPAQEAPLKAKAIDALVEEYVQLDGKQDDGRARRREILALLETVAPLDERDARSWRKTIAKVWSKGPELEQKTGRHYLWDEDGEERGLYIVGGDARKPKGLFLGMHGGGLGSGDAWSAHGALNAAAKDMDWVAIFPEVLEKTEHGWTTSGTEEFVLELVERALRTWDLDRNRVFFGGHSMGGYGTWTLGAHHADVVAALTPSAGAPTPVYSGGEIIDVDWGVIPNLRNVPIVIYQSDDDPQVPPGPNRKAAELLAKAREEHGGYDYEYWEVTGHGHGPPPGGYAALLEKVHERARQPRPDKVLWQPTLDWKRQQYWLWWDRPQRNALVQATFDRDAREVRVRTEAGGAGLHVLLNDAMLDLGQEVAVFFNDAEVFRGVPERSLAALVSTGCRGDEDLTFDVRIPVVP